MTDFLTGSDQKPDLKMALAYISERLGDRFGSGGRTIGLTWVLIDVFDIPPGKIVEAARKLASQ